MPEPRPSGTVIDAGLSVPLMAARGVTCRVGGRELLSGIDLIIRPGRRTVIIGPNGAGKSVLLRVLHGLVFPSGGEILWKGRRLDRKAKAAQAMVFQRPVLLRRSVLANLRFALKVSGFTGLEAARRCDQALGMAGLEDMAHRPARVLSGGQQQRLALARALVCGPEMLFLDEPTASLDPASTARVEALIDEAHGSGITVVMVTHDQGQARRIADDAVFLQDGQVAETGPAQTVLNAPRSEAARAWLDGRLYLDPRPR